MAGLLVAMSASVLPAWGAPPVHQIEAEWAPGTPAVVSNGNLVTAVWRVNVNDAANPPANDPVPNMTLKVTATNGKFAGLPGGCKTTGVTPASSVSADGKTLTCNLGIQRMGTAYVVQAPMVVNGLTGQQISATGTIGDQTAAVRPIPIRNVFGMDMLWGGTTNYRQGGPGPGNYGFDLEWTLRSRRGSDPGPRSVSYTLTVANTNRYVLSAGAARSTGPARPGCTPFDLGAGAPGHPWSGRNVANKTAPFVRTCTLTKLRRDAQGRDIFRLTLSGIDYSKVLRPTQDSTGRSLGSVWEPVASGSIWLTIAGLRSGTGVSLTSSAPTYRSPSGLTSTDSAANNTSSKTVTLTGDWSHAWRRGFTGSGGTSWDNSYQVPQGELVSSATTNRYGESAGVPNTAVIGDCDVIDTRYSVYSSHSVEKVNRVTSVRTKVTGYGTQYYIGPAPANPNTFSCAGSRYWTSRKPANLAQIKAVRVTYRRSAVAGAYAQLFVNQTIKVNAPIGRDVWTWGSTLRYNPALRRSVWQNPARDTAPGSPSRITPVPRGRYPYTTGARDVLHVTGPMPDVMKSASPTVVQPGAAFSYFLRYRVDYGRPTVNGLVLSDTLPPGVTYLAGSATPAPTVTRNAAGQQVLTWRLNNVKTDTWILLRFKAVAGSSVRPGQALNNCVRATIAGRSAQACAQVTISASGYTTILKTPDVKEIPDPDSNGSGTGSFTVTLRSFDPAPQSFTDTIDILPYVGDGRGTAYSGTYTLEQVTAVAGATVYYTTTAPASLNDDPNNATNGSAGTVTGNSVGWTTTYTPNATAVRVIGPALAPGATQTFKVPITTQNAQAGDRYVNRAQARAGHTRLVMRTSAPLVQGPWYRLQLKKYVLGRDGKWYDANTDAEAVHFQTGDTVRYRIVVTNTGGATLTDIDVKDNKYPQLGNFKIASLAPGANQAKEFEIKLTEKTSGARTNTACANNAQVPEQSCDPVVIKWSTYTTVKTSSPKDGSSVQPGSKVTYTVTVTQHGYGPVDAKFDENLADVLDDAKYGDDVKATIGTAQYNDGKITWRGTVPEGGNAVVTYSVTVKSAERLAAEGDYKLRNVVTSPGCRTKADCETVHDLGRYQFSKVSDPKSGSTVEVGQTVKYTVTITQLGKGGVDKARITDDLSGQLDDTRYNDDAKASTGAVKVNGDKLTWVGDLAVGAKATITYTLTVTGDGDRHLVNVVTSPTKRGTCDESVGCKTEHWIHRAGDLPETGNDLSLELIAAGVLVLAGGTLLVTGIVIRRRRNAN